LTTVALSFYRSLSLFSHPAGCRDPHPWSRTSCDSVRSGGARRTQGGTCRDTV